MAYVRRKGNQLAVVHGVRDPETKTVEQKTLFSIYSKAEALAAVGGSSHHFRNILEDENPGIRFDWGKVDDGIRENLDHLPDLYSYKKERLEDGFRTAMVGFAKELMLTDPQSLMSSARLLQGSRHQLEYLRDLIGWRLKLCDQEESEFNVDNPFFWRTMSHRREVPPEEWEKLGHLYGKREYDKAEALAELLVECWPNFAAGYNYLGLIAMERDELVDAVDHFDEAMRVGRTLFPKRIRKDHWWTNHDTRPYIRALVYKVQALNRMGDYVGALLLCDRLENECYQDMAAADERVPVMLNAGQWKEAAKAARHVHNIYPQQNLPLAFALFEMGDQAEALVHFVRAAVQFPLAASLLATGGAKEPENHEEARDYNDGIEILRELGPYLDAAGQDFDEFFGVLAESGVYQAMLEEHRHSREAWRENRSDDRTAYRKMIDMQSEDWARGTAAVLAAELDLEKLNGCPEYRR